MTIYEYRCTECGYTANVTDRADSLGACPARQCSGLLKRVWRVNFGAVMQEHFNATVGKPISDGRQFERELRRMSDERTAATGIEHRFAPVDPTDTKTLGVNHEGLASTNALRVRNGLKPVHVAE